jgi:PKD repeat protein
MTQVLDRRLNQTSVGLLAFTEIAAISDNNESVLARRFDYSVNPDSTILIFVEVPDPATFDTNGQVMDRRGFKRSDDLLHFLEVTAFATVGVPAGRVGLPVLSDIDDVQLIIRAGAFVVDFTGSPLYGLPPHGVQFVNSSQSPVEGWFWQFGDGNTSTERDPFHVYIDEGLYTVTLRAGSPVFGFSSKTRPDYINVGVLLIIDPLSGDAPLKVNFAVDERILN